MKEKQKIFIRGNKYRRNEIKDILTGLGATTEYLSCDNDHFIYFITHENEISIALIGSEVARIIMDNYKEIELPPQWHDGDILISKDEPLAFAVFDYFSDEYPDRFCQYFHTDSNGKAISGCLPMSSSDYRLATPEEAKRFRELLCGQGLRWDDKRKELVDLCWKPKNGECYFTVRLDGHIAVGNVRWTGTLYDDDCVCAGNCFRTQAEAEAMADKIRELLREGNRQ